jgi:hypothetical protein
MAVVGILRELWHRRLLVLAGVVLALAVHVLLTYHVTPGLPPKLESRQYEVGVASAAVLIDSQSSQVVDLGGGEVRTDVVALATRAELLANLLASRPLRDDIAEKAGVPADRLITKVSSSSEEIRQPAPDESLDVVVSADDVDANILRLQTSDTVPIISVGAQAPEQRVAAKIAAATVATLSSYLQSVAATNRVPDVRQLVMRPLGEPTSAMARRGPGVRSAMFASVLLLMAWCGGILLFARLSNAWRQAVVADQFESELALDAEREAAGQVMAVGVGEGPHDELEPAHPPDATSRVA